MNNRQAGLTMVELLVALALQALLLATITYVYVASKQTYVAGSELASVTNDGRYLLDLMGWEVRSSGYAGCRSLDELSPNIVALDPPDFSDIDESLAGYEAATGWVPPATFSAKAGTDVISLRFAGGAGTKLIGDMIAENANIQITGNPDDIKADDLVMVTDCRSLDLFRATAVSASAGTITITHAAATNTTNRLSRAYQDGAFVLKFKNVDYFISDSGGLYRVEDGRPPQFMLGTVEDLQFQYAVDSDGDLQPDQYVDASAVASWKDVVGVVAGMLLVSERNVTTEPQVFLFNGTDANTAADRRLRKALWSYMDLRNR